MFKIELFTFAPCTFSKTFVFFMYKTISKAYCYITNKSCAFQTKLFFIHHFFFVKKL